MTLPFKLERSSSFGSTGKLCESQSAMHSLQINEYRNLRGTNNNYALLLHLQLIGLDLWLLELLELLLLVLRGGVHHGLVLVLRVNGRRHRGWLLKFVMYLLEIAVVVGGCGGATIFATVLVAIGVLISGAGDRIFLLVSMRLMRRRREEFQWPWNF